MFCNDCRYMRLFALMASGRVFFLGLVFLYNPQRPTERVLMGKVK